MKKKETQVEKKNYSTKINDASKILQLSTRKSFKPG